MKANQLLLAMILASAIGAPIETLAEDKSVIQQMTPAAFRPPVEGELPSLGSATGRLNSQPLTAAALRGKVVLVEFWTYSCINWLRTLPYLRAWAEKYKCRGLVVIGVHSPEFQFEKSVDNVRLAAKDMKVDYPIAIDSDLRYGVLSRTGIGRHCIPSMHKDAFDIINSARANTGSRRGSFSNAGRELSLSGPQSTGCCLAGCEKRTFAGSLCGGSECRSIISGRDSNRSGLRITRVLIPVYHEPRCPFAYN